MEAHSPCPPGSDSDLQMIPSDSANIASGRNNNLPEVVVSASVIENNLHETAFSAPGIDINLTEAAVSASAMDGILPELDVSAFGTDKKLPEVAVSAFGLDNNLPDISVSASGIDDNLPEAAVSTSALDSILPEAVVSTSVIESKLPEVAVGAYCIDNNLPEAAVSAPDINIILCDFAVSAPDIRSNLLHSAVYVSDSAGSIEKKDDLHDCLATTAVDTETIDSNDVTCCGSTKGVLEPTQSDITPSRQADYSHNPGAPQAHYKAEDSLQQNEYNLDDYSCSNDTSGSAAVAIKAMAACSSSLSTASLDGCHSTKVEYSEEMSSSAVNPEPTKGKQYAAAVVTAAVAADIDAIQIYANCQVAFPPFPPYPNPSGSIDNYLALKFLTLLAEQDNYSLSLDRILHELAPAFPDRQLSTAVLIELSQEYSHLVELLIDIRGRLRAQLRNRSRGDLPPLEAPLRNLAETCCSRVRQPNSAVKLSALVCCDLMKCPCPMLAVGKKCSRGKTSKKASSYLAAVSESSLSSNSYMQPSESFGEDSIKGGGHQTPEPSLMAASNLAVKVDCDPSSTSNGDESPELSQIGAENLAAPVTNLSPVSCGASCSHAAMPSHETEQRSEDSKVPNMPTTGETNYNKDGVTILRMVWILMEARGALTRDQLMARLLHKNTKGEVTAAVSAAASTKFSAPASTPASRTAAATTSASRAAATTVSTAATTIAPTAAGEEQQLTSLLNSWPDIFITCSPAYVFLNPDTTVLLSQLLSLASNASLTTFSNSKQKRRMLSVSDKTRLCPENSGSILVKHVTSSLYLNVKHASYRAVIKMSNMLGCYHVPLVNVPGLSPSLLGQPLNLYLRLTEGSKVGTSLKVEVVSLLEGGRIYARREAAYFQQQQQATIAAEQQLLSASGIKKGGSLKQIGAIEDSETAGKQSFPVDFSVTAGRAPGSQSTTADFSTTAVKTPALSVTADEEPEKQPSPSSFSDSAAKTTQFTSYVCPSSVSKPSTSFEAAEFLNQNKLTQANYHQLTLHTIDQLICVTGSPIHCLYQSLLKSKNKQIKQLSMKAFENYLQDENALFVVTNQQGGKTVSLQPPGAKFVERYVSICPRFALVSDAMKLKIPVNIDGLPVSPAPEHLPGAYQSLKVWLQTEVLRYNLTRYYFTFQPQHQTVFFFQPAKQELKEDPEVGVTGRLRLCQMTIEIQPISGKANLSLKALPLPENFHLQQSKPEMMPLMNKSKGYGSKPKKALPNLSPKFPADALAEAPRTASRSIISEPSAAQKEEDKLWEEPQQLELLVWSARDGQIVDIPALMGIGEGEESFAIEGQEDDNFDKQLSSETMERKATTESQDHSIHLEFTEIGKAVFFSTRCKKMTCS